MANRKLECLFLGHKFCKRFHDDNYMWYERCEYCGKIDKLRAFEQYNPDILKARREREK